ncbi:MAG: hypothetical protein HKN29_13380 [Rhodothermales bacterium]|nr:hypothetical protein [Rhodothermales bacterium]
MKSPTLATPLSPGGSALWTAAQVTALAVTAAVLAGLFLAPELTLKIAWFAVVPLLPASFLINPGLWRGICPIATANTFKAPAKGRVLSPKAMNQAAWIGIVLLLVLVPARRLFLNQNGPALAITLVAIVALAFVGGRLFRVKAGFCNSICPVLPVEKLYGQSPLLWVRNPRCVPCAHCVTKTCIDLDQPRAIGAGNGTRTGRDWLKTPMGLFAAAFPGFIWGYFQTQDMALAEWASVYTTVLGPAVVSLVVVGAILLVVNPSTRAAAPVLGAAAIGVYYWFAGPASAEAFGLPATTALGLRWIPLALVALWLVRALQPSGKQRATA